MSQETQKSTDYNLVEIFKENDAALVGLIEKIRTISANTITPSIKEEIEKLRVTMLEADVKHQITKLEMMNDVLNKIGHAN